MRSLWAGVSGLTNHQTRMDVLGNNIANVNTTGFKRGRTEFQDMLSQTLSGAAKPTTEVGGVNPIQVGLGMMVKSIDTIHTQGALQSTGVMTDLALQGNGFFVRAGREPELLHPGRLLRASTVTDGWSIPPTACACRAGWHAPWPARRS